MSQSGSSKDRQVGKITKNILDAQQGGYELFVFQVVGLVQILFQNFRESD